MVSCDETSMTAQPMSRPFHSPPWYGPLWNMLLLLGTPHLQKDVQLERIQRRTVIFCCGEYTNRTPECDDDMLKLLHWESLETRRKSNRLSLLHKINPGHVDITVDQYHQWSDPRTRGAQSFRSARADHPALYHSFIQLVEQAPHTPISHHMPKDFQGWPSCLNICFILFIIICPSK